MLFQAFFAFSIFIYMYGLFMCRSEVDIGNHLLSLLFLILYIRVPQSNPELADMTTLASQIELGRPNSTLRLGLQVGCNVYLAFAWVLGMQTPILILAQQSVLITKPSPYLVFLDRAFWYRKKILIFEVLLICLFSFFSLCFEC